MTERLSARPRLVADGDWCPMSHGNRRVDGFQQLPPPTGRTGARRIDPPWVSPWGGFHLGAFSSPGAVLCAYPDPDGPALVAYDPGTLQVLWATPRHDLQGGNRRMLAAPLLALLQEPDRPPQRRVYAASPSEVIAYDQDGRLVWRRPSSTLPTSGPAGVGRLISLTYTDSGELVTATDGGWLLCLDPRDGRCLAAWPLGVTLDVGGRPVRGVLRSMKSIAVAGDVLYVLGTFTREGAAAPSPRSPVMLARLELPAPRSSGGPRITLHRVGVHRAGGSPCLLPEAPGRVLVIANAEQRCRGGLRPVVVGVEDDHGTLRERWRSVVGLGGGDAIHAAPALHGPSRTLVVTTRDGMFVYRGIDGLSGSVPAPPTPPPADLLATGRPGMSVGYGSPVTLAQEVGSDRVVAVTNFRMGQSPDAQHYGFVGAFQVPAGAGRCRPMWSFPLARTPSGAPAPSPGTFGQPALVQLQGGTGVVVTTARTGTWLVT